MEKENKLTIRPDGRKVLDLRASQTFVTVEDPMTSIMSEVLNTNKVEDPMTSIMSEMLNTHKEVSIHLKEIAEALSGIARVHGD
jgi:hypothetical protein